MMIIDEYPPYRNKLKKNHNPQMNEWTSNIKNTILINLETANNTMKIRKINFEFPMYIKIDKLKLVEMYSFGISDKKPKFEKNNKLLGLDFLSKIKLILEEDFETDDILITLENLHDIDI